MTYRELLEKCKNDSGCLSTKEQKKADSIIKYRKWMVKSNEEYLKEKD